MTRNAAVTSPSAARTAGSSRTPAPAAHAATRSRNPSSRPAGPSMTRSWLSWVVISFQPWFSSPTSMSAGTRTSLKYVALTWWEPSAVMIGVHE